MLKWLTLYSCASALNLAQQIESKVVYLERQGFEVLDIQVSGGEKIAIIKYHLPTKENPQ